MDGLKGFPEAIEAVFPKTAVQLCIVHMVSYSLNTWAGNCAVQWPLICALSTPPPRSRKPANIWPRLRSGGAQPIRPSSNPGAATGCVIQFFAYQPEIRRVIHTTNAIEALSISLRKVTKNRGSFPSDESVLRNCDYSGKATQFFLKTSAVG